MRQRVLTVLALAFGLSVAPSPTSTATATPAAANDTPACEDALYVANYSSNSVSVIDIASQTVTNTITGVEGAYLMTVTPDSSTVYVTNQNTGGVAAIDTGSGAVSAVSGVTFLFSDFPAMSPDGSKLYVSSVFANAIAVIDPATNAQISTITITRPFGVAITPDGSRAYVGNQQQNTLSVLDLASATVTTTIPIGAGAGIVTLSADGSTAYVSNQLSGTVSVIDTATNTVTADITVGNNAFGAFVTPDGSEAWVPSSVSGTVNVFDTATNTISGTFDVGGGSSDVVFSPDGSTAYIAVTNNDLVSVVDTATKTVTSTIPVGRTPFGLISVPCVSEPALSAEVTGDGRTINVTGINFPATASVELTLGTTTLGTATTNADGEFTATFANVDCSIESGTLAATSGDASAATEVTLEPCPPPSTTTTVPATTTTVAPGPPRPVPDPSGQFPRLAPGTGTAFENGVQVPVEVFLENSALVMLGPNFELQLRGDCGTGCEVITTPDGRQVIALRERGDALVNGLGFKPGTPVYVWLFSEPRFLGELMVAEDGTFSGELPLGDIPPGEHTLQVNGTSLEGGERTANLGVVVGDGSSALPATGASVTSLVVAGGTLLALGGAVVALASRRRRFHDEAVAI